MGTMSLIRLNIPFSYNYSATHGLVGYLVYSLKPTAKVGMQYGLSEQNAGHSFRLIGSARNILLARCLREICGG